MANGVHQDSTFSNLEFRACCRNVEVDIYKFPGDADATALGTSLWKPLSFSKLPASCRAYPHGRFHAH